MLSFRLPPLSGVLCALAVAAASSLSAGDRAPQPADCDGNGIEDALEAAGEPVLGAARSIAVGLLPHELVAADLDGDGDADLVSTDRLSDTLTVLLGDGRGGFEASQSVEVGDEPRGIAAGDVDGDGDLDLVCGSGNEDSVGDLPSNSVLRNRGDGRFDAERYLASPIQAGALRSLHLVDLDLDGDLDVVNGFSDALGGGVITLLSNDGHGALSAPVLVHGGEPPYGDLRSAKYLAIVDVDEDGYPDLVTLTGQWLRNGGDGSLAAPESFASIEDAINVLAADLDGDGDLDLAFVREVSSPAGSTGEVVLFVKDGPGFVERAPRVHLPAQMQEGIGAADLDGDGDLDLAVTFHESAVALLTNDGDGRFELEPVSFFLGGGRPRWLVAFDANGDGRPDVAVPKQTHEVTVLLNLAGRDENRDGVLDSCETRFFRGDPDADGRATLADAVRVLAHLFLAAAEPSCRESADTDDDGRLLVTDAVALLGFLFLGSAAPPPPGPPAAACSLERGAPPFLGCESYAPCEG